MMQILYMQIIKIIFVLSTIVAVTDCCSSRILLLREHTLKIVEHQHNFHNHLHEHAHQLQQQIEEHVVQLVNQMELQQKLDEQLQHATDLGPETDTATDSEPETDTATIESLMESAVASTPQISISTVSESETDCSTSEDSTTTTSTTVTPTGEPPPEDTTTSTTVVPTLHTDSATLSSVTPSTSKESVEFNMLPCTEPYKTNFCLNGGHCFRYPLSNHSLHSCICPDGYDGSRCDYKNWNGDYVSTPVSLEAQPRILMAHIVFSFPMLILLSTIYVLFAAIFMFRNAPEHRRKQQQLHMHKPRFFVSC